MRCIVTAGPTYEPLDGARRLTNFSTGRLGSELASFLTSRGHEVALLIGQQATWHGDRRASSIHSFTTTSNLRDQLRALEGKAADAVFHAAAVSDFSFGKVWFRAESGELTEIRSGKISTRQGPLLAELVPTPKIIAELRQIFPRSRIVGWKYEVDGGRLGVIRLAREQILDCRTDACVANGPAYGEGFGLVNSEGECAHLSKSQELFKSLERFTKNTGAPS